MSFVAGIGRANIDLLYSGLSHIPREGEEVYSKDFDLQLGGGPVATMINLQRLGVPVKVLTFLGKDMFSAFAEQQLHEYGIEAINLYGGGKIPVNISTAMITGRDRTFVSYNQLQQTTADQLKIAESEIEGAKIVEMQPGFLELYRTLKQRRTLLVLDMGWEDDLSFEKYRDYFELADYYTPNLKEALYLTGTDNPLDALKILSQWFTKPIVKIGDQGCLIKDEEGIWQIPHIDEFESTDATGAGDAFLSGFIYGLYHEADFRTAILYGNIMGGKAVTEVGCLTASLSEQELLHYADRYLNRIARISEKSHYTSIFPVNPSSSI